MIFGNNATITAIIDTTNPASNATLKPTGTFTFSGISNPVTLTTTQDASGNWELQATVTFAPQQSNNFQVSYSGDSNYASSNSYVFVTVTTPDFSVSAGSAPLAITAGQTGTETLTITPATSYTSTVQLSCVNFNMPGATCAISPSSVTLSNSTAATATLTITTTAPSNMTSARIIPVGLHRMLVPFGRGEWWSLSLLAGLAALFLMLMPGRRDSRRVAWGFGMACVLSLVIGCGGGGSSGPESTTTSLTASSTRVAVNSWLTLSSSVTAASGGTPAGTVIFSSPSSSCNLDANASLTNGKAQLQVSFVVGTCAVSAEYTGFGNDLSSQSGTLEITTTGNVGVQIEGQTGQDSHFVPISLTIQ